MPQLLVHRVFVVLAERLFDQTEIEISWEFVAAFAVQLFDAVQQILG